jgi:selenocysteine lyase/cysteine desulfurase
MLSTAQRAADLPWLEGRTYLNTAAEGIPPRSVIEALAAYGEDKKLGMDGRPLHEAQRQACREVTAQFYGLSANEIAICSCSSEAYNLLALALNLRDGDEVVINDLDFPAGATPWLQPTCPATVRVWRSRAGALRVEDLRPLLNPRTRLVTVSMVSFYNGFRLPLPNVLAAVRQHSPALLALDVTQALGRIELDLRDVDFICSSTHKWILASHGGGLVGVPAERANDLTARAGGWFHLSNAFDADRFERAVTRPGAASFAVGMPNYSAIYAARAGLAYLQALGVAKIEAYGRPLVRQCLDGLRALGVELLTPDESDALAGIVAFRHPRAEQLHKHLHARNIHVMCSAGRLRVALHFYNTADDVERLLRGIREFGG